MNTLTFFAFYALLLIPDAVWAQGQAQGTGSGAQNSIPGSGSIKIESPLAMSSITELFQALLEILLILAIPIVVFFIIYAGFLYVTAQGNVDQITKAHRALLYAIIGGLLILGGNVLIEVIGGTVDAVRR